MLEDEKKGVKPNIKPRDKKPRKKSKRVPKKKPAPASPAENVDEETCEDWFKKMAKPTL